MENSDSSKSEKSITTTITAGQGRTGRWKSVLKSSEDTNGFGEHS